MRTVCDVLCLGALLAFAALTASAKHTLTQTGSGWPACDPSVVQRSGYLDIDAAEDKHYFYWMFEAKKNASTAPVILWMTGGPGCSSSLAILAENGPCHMNETTGELYNNPYSWNNVANIIYIDQPAGVGFSYANFPNGYDYNETMVADDMYTFLQAFYTQFPQYQKNPLFIYGESYGGHYAPATAHRVWRGNKAGTGVHVPLTGLSVGNGMTDPVVQFQWYSKLSYQWCQMVKGAPCVDESTYEQMRQELPECVAAATGCNQNQGGCSLAMDICSSSQMGPFQNTGLNVYDIRIPCEVPGLCYDFSKSTAFMNRQDVQTSLGVASRGITWQSCNMGVNQMFGSDWMRDFNTSIPDLLNSGIRVLLYAGDVDFICNWLGNKAWALGLQWSGAAAFNSALDLPWWVAEQPAGRFRSVAGNGQQMLFTFLQVHDAGHMVPMNQPQRALEMVTHFLGDAPFYGFAGPLPHVGPTPPSTSAAPATPAPSMPPVTTGPAANTFTQKVCGSSTCTTDCQEHSFPTGRCLPMQDGLSAVVQCSATELVMNVYESTDCSGQATPQTMGLNVCLEDSNGNYLENSCTTGGASSRSSALMRRSKQA